MVDILNHVLPPTEQCRVVAGPHVTKGHTVEICKMVKTVEPTLAHYILYSAECSKMCSNLIQVDVAWC